MPQTIEVPGLGTVEFPDGLSDDQIVASIKKTRVKQNQALLETPPTTRTPNVLDIWSKNLSQSPVVQAAQGVSGQLGKVAQAIPADVAAVASNSPQFGGNINAAASNKPLPIDTAISDAAKEAKFRGEKPIAATVANISQGLAQTAPMIPLLGGLPAAAQQALLVGFTAKMVSDTPEIAKQLGMNSASRKKTVITTRFPNWYPRRFRP